MERRPIHYTKLTLRNMNIQLKEYNSVVSSNNNGPQRRHSKLLEYLRRCRRISFNTVQVDLTAEQPSGAAANNTNLNPVQGDPTLNDPSQPLTFKEHSEVELYDVTFKGVVALGIRFTSCKKLSIAGNIQTTQAILRTIDPAYLQSLEQFNLTVSDAEEEQ